jgi:predicted nuclease of predicted toxin-antitoxin system
MKILADESVDAQVVARLRQDGFEVLYVAEISPSISDNEVLNLANKESALLLTVDKDFGELIYRQRRFVAGVVLTRLAELSLTAEPEVVAQAFREHGAEFEHSFTVITPGNIRIRKAL